MALNNVTLTGRLTKEFELRYTPAGKAVGNGTLAVARDYKDDNGDRPTDFLPFVVWGQLAEVIANNFGKKGNLATVVGRLQSRSYENNEGITVYVNEVNVNEFYMLAEPQEQDNSNQRQGNNRQQNNSRQNNSRQSTNRR